MKTENKEVHSCDYCNKKLFIKGAMKRHEENCIRNPKNQTQCHDCDFCKVVKKEVLKDENFDTSWMESDSYYCANENIKQEMYPHKVIRKGLLKKYPETFANAVLMPNKCKFFVLKPLPF